MSSPLVLWDPSHQAAGSSHARLEPTLCHATVNKGESRWPRYEQCDGKVKGQVLYSDGKSYPTCGRHIGVVERSMKRAEQRQAAARADEANLAHAQDGARWLKERYGIDVDIEYSTHGRTYTGRIIVDPDALWRVFEKESKR